MRYGVGVGVAALAAVAAVVFVIVTRRDDADPDVVVARQAPARVDERSPEPPAAQQTDTRREAVPSATLVATGSWQELLEMSSNYLEFVDRVLPAARDGDASAQFALYQALEYCEDGYRGYFDRSGKRRTLDEALEWASTRMVNADAVRDVHRRCEALMARGNGELGRAENWLDKASAAGVPAAQTRKALGELREVYLQTVPWPDRPALSAKEFEERRASARALVIEAVAAGDPAATWDAADVIYYLTGSGATADTEQWVWKMAACLQGYDCAPGAAWVTALCDYAGVNPCRGGETGTDIIRQAWRQASGRSDSSEFDQRAQQLAERLNSGHFSDEDLSEFMGTRRTP